MGNWIEKEEQALCDMLNRGEISPQEFNKQMADLQREYRDMAREAAEQAYERELDNW